MSGPEPGSYLALATGAAIVAALIVADRRAGVRDRVLPATFAALVTIGVLTTVADSGWIAAAVRWAV